jgi:hypothetical protein
MEPRNLTGSLYLLYFLCTLTHRSCDRGEVGLKAHVAPI